jgi:hypothetical protein
MEKFIRHFVRKTRGIWLCVESCSVDSPVGRIQVAAGTSFVRGIRFMNYDLAAALDDEYERQERAHSA